MWEGLCLSSTQPLKPQTERPCLLVATPSRTCGLLGWWNKEDIAEEWCAALPYFTLEVTSNTSALFEFAGTSYTVPPNWKRSKEGKGTEEIFGEPYCFLPQCVEGLCNDWSITQWLRQQVLKSDWLLSKSYSHQLRYHLCALYWK